MTDLRKLLETLEDYVVQALDQHDQQYQRHPSTERDRQVIVNDLEALRQALAQPEQEPAAWQDPQYKTLIEPHKAHPDWIPLYATPPKREWVGLTDEEFMAIAKKYSLSTRVGLEYFKDELEAKLKEKNT